MEHTLLTLREQITEAAAQRQPLRIVGGGSKDFYGQPINTAHHVLDIRPLSGVVAYDPAELVITAFAGTPLAEIEAVLAESRQILPFEPPHFGGAATLGGAVAAGLSGPRRAHVGGVKDFVLGVRMLNSKGELLHFGGTVVKNVAGYDVARLLAGSMGTLGVITEVSLKVLPMPFAEVSLRFACTAAEAQQKLNTLMGQPWPLSGSYWHDNVLTLRLSGTTAGVNTAVAQLGGQQVDLDEAQAFWQAVRHQTRPEFQAFVDGQTEMRLWRVCVPDTAPLAQEQAALLGEPLAMEWGGGVRWYANTAAASSMQQEAARLGGHAVLFRGALNDGETVFAPLPQAAKAVQARLKQHFDPAGIFNPGRLYPDL